jgi:predicted phage terminase large subunit-like protein
MLAQASDWWGSTWASRLNDSVTRKGVKIVIGQRIHTKDLIGYLLSDDENARDWVHLCLPALYEKKHPYRYPVQRKLSSGRVIQGDLRRKENEPLAPSYMDLATLRDATRDMTSHVFSGQYQQRPAPREGAILKREWWRFYDPRHRGVPDKLPRFGMVVLSVDTPQKDKETSDNVAITCWGIAGADRYLLDIEMQRMNYGKAKRRVLEMTNWARKLWPNCAHFILIENAGYGVELIVDLRREVTGVTKISPAKDGDKVMRAESASDSLESSNVFLPGVSLQQDGTGGMNERESPADIVAFVNSCALFPYGSHDDDVDSWSQAMNWLRGRSQSPARTASALKGFTRRS